MCYEIFKFYIIVLYWYIKLIYYYITALYSCMFFTYVWIIIYNYFIFIEIFKSLRKNWYKHRCMIKIIFIDYFDSSHTPIFNKLNTNININNN